MSKVKLVVCDLDNTLVNVGEPISEGNRKAIEDLRKNGVLFGIASGRCLDPQIMSVAERWGMDQFDLLIGMNGSEIWDNINEKRHDFYRLSTASMKEALEIAMSVGNYKPQIYRDGAIVFYNVTEEFAQSVCKRNQNMPYVICKTIDEMCTEENAKIMIRGEEDEILKLESYFKAHPSKDYNAFKTQKVMLEVADPRINKGEALSEFCKIHDIDSEEVAAFGDQDNDIDMLKVAGMSVCLLNGNDACKAASKYVTDKVCAEDGFADFVYKNIL